MVLESGGEFAVAMSHIPRFVADEEAAVIRHFQLVLKTFKQLEAEGKTALRVVTVADGC